MAPATTDRPKTAPAPPGLSGGEVITVADAELMAGVAAGDESALEQVFVRWVGPLVAYFHRLGCHPGWVEDLTEETLITLYRRRGRFDPTRPLAPWIWGIARLVWKDHLRHRGRDLYRSTSLDEVDAIAAPEPHALQALERQEEGELVRRGILRLPVAQREALILRHYHGLSYDEVARAVEAPLGTIKWRIHEAMRRLEADLARGLVRGPQAGTASESGSCSWTSSTRKVLSTSARR